MTLHYHGTPISPIAALYELAGRCFCVSFARPDDVKRICIGSTAEYAGVLSPIWERRMDDVFNEVSKRHRWIPYLHMLRGMQCVGRRWPFASVDSTDIAQNHHRPQNTPRSMVDRWDAVQCPAAWKRQPEQLEFA